MRRVLLLGVAAAACDRGGPAPEAPPRSLAFPCSLGADAGRALGYQRALDSTLAIGAPERLLTEGLATSPTRIATVVTCPDAPFLLGPGVVTDLLVAMPGREATPAFLRGAYADWSDGWQVHLTPPRDRFDGMRVIDAAADLSLSLADRWVTATVTLEVQVDATPDGDRRLVLLAPPLEAPVTDRGAPLHDGFRLTAATVDGEPADLALGAGGYLVIGGLRASLARVELRYQGPLPLVGDNQAEAGVLELHRWLPTVPFAPPAPLALTVHHPASDALIASLPASGDDARDPARDGWRVARFAGAVDRDPSLLLLDRAPSLETWDDGRGSHLDLWASPALDAAPCAPGLARVIGALAPLGPIGRVRVVAAPSLFGRHGRRVGDLVVLLRDQLVALCSPDVPDDELRARKDAAIELLAHELAHGWFGRDVRAADDEAGAWWEAVAEYVSSWAVDDVAAATLRRHWEDDYGQAVAHDLFALAARAPTSGDVHDALSYDKGALLLAALEDRIGRARVAAVLRHLIADRRGRLGSWLDLVAATQEVAGSEAARWLHGWLYEAGPLELRVDAVRDATRGVARVTIESSLSALPSASPPVPAPARFGDASPAVADTVEVAVFAKDRLLVDSRVPLSGRRTVFAIAAPDGADRVVVDPFSRLPHVGPTDAAL